LVILLCFFELVWGEENENKRRISKKKKKKRGEAEKEDEVEENGREGDWTQVVPKGDSLFLPNLCTFRQ